MTKLRLMECSDYRTMYDEYGDGLLYSDNPYMGKEVSICCG